MAVSLIGSFSIKTLLSYTQKGGRCIAACRRQTTDVTITDESADNKEKEKDKDRDKERAEHHQYEENIRHKILEASLPFVHEMGWSKSAISAGAGSLGYPGVIHGMFPQGGADLISYFYVSCNQRLAEQLKVASETAERDKSSLKEPPVLVRDALETRLRMITPYLSHWPQALAVMTLPPNVPTALANLLTLVDDVCYYAGDRSVDFNWYSRRIALAAIYKMTELYMMQDMTEDHMATWQFLTRRVDEAAQLHAVMMQSETGVQFAKEMAAATFTTARNILGLNR